MTALLAEGLALGLSTGLACVGACLPAILPCMLAEEGRPSRAVGALLQFLAGRLAAYLLFAVTAGLAGANMSTLPPWFAGAALLASGLVLLGYSVVRAAPTLGPCARLAGSPAVRGTPLLLGFLAGINICPPFVAGLVRLLTIGSVAGCLAYFSAFFVGTTVYLLPVLLAVPLRQVERLKSGAAIAAGLSGLWFAGLGLARLLG